MEKPIVNPSSHAPEPINFTFYTKASWLKHNDALAVTSVDGVDVFQVKRSDGHQIMDNTGQIVLSMKKRTERPNEQWQVFKGDSPHPSHLLFTMKKSPNYDSEKVFDMFLQANTAEKECDYKIKGSYRQKTCILYEGDSSTVVFKEHINSFSYLEGSRRMETSIVNPNSRAPEPINFTFYTKASWLKPDDALAVTGVDGVVVFQVKRRLWSRDEHQFIDNTGKIVLCMKKWTETSNEQWEVFKGDSSHPKYLLFTMKKSPNFDSEEVFDLFLQANIAEKKCDYKIKGSYRQKTCILYVGDSSTVVFEMSRRSRSENCVVSQEEAFKVAGQLSMDYLFVVAVVAVLHVHHSEQEKKETKGKKVNVFHKIRESEVIVFGKWDKEEK